jgi:hypothetical protein
MFRTLLFVPFLCHCIVCPSIYSSSLPLWYFHTFPEQSRHILNLSRHIFCICICNVTSYDPGCWAMIWQVESDLFAMVRDRGLETFEFLCWYVCVFVQVVPINSCLYEEWVFILIGSTRWDHYTFTVVSYRGNHYSVSYTIVKFFFQLGLNHAWNWLDSLSCLDNIWKVLNKVFILEINIYWMK